MQPDPKAIKKHFEKSMDKYDENAVVQKFLAEKLADELCEFSQRFDKILELGAGTGLLTREIRSKINYKKYTANDLSEKSKTFISGILPEFDFICGNAQRIKPAGKVDLIISNAMFQWFNNLEEIFLQYKNFLNQNGVLAFSTFLPKNFSELKDLTGLSLEYKSEEEIRTILEKNYEIIALNSFENIMEFKTPLELLYHMKNTGVNSLKSSRWTFADVKGFCENYNKKFKKVTLTYSSIVVVARKLD